MFNSILVFGAAFFADATLYFVIPHLITSPASSSVSSSRSSFFFFKTRQADRRIEQDRQRDTR